jgi:hypothetical protein
MKSVIRDLTDEKLKLQKLVAQSQTALNDANDSYNRKFQVQVN